MNGEYVTFYLIMALMIFATGFMACGAVATVI